VPYGLVRGVMMPEKRLQKTKQAYCEHEWHEGVGIDDLIRYKCFKCGKIHFPGIDDSKEFTYQQKSEQ